MMVGRAVEILYRAGADTDTVLEDETSLVTAIVKNYGVIMSFVSSGKEYRGSRRARNDSLSGRMCSLSPSGET